MQTCPKVQINEDFDSLHTVVRTIISIHLRAINSLVNMRILISPLFMQIRPLRVISLLVFLDLSSLSLVGIILNGGSSNVRNISACTMSNRSYG